MIQLHPTASNSFHICPYCQVQLETKGWHIPGMRNLADLRCSQCGRKFYGDLPAGHGLYFPMLIEQTLGIVHDKNGVKWFADWLRDSYANRVDSSIGLTIENFRPLRKAILLNCLDTLYGHSLLKLLNAQYYLDRRPDLDLVILIPRCLRWMVPEGVAAIWTVDLPLKHGIEWNDWLGAEIKRRIEPLETCWLSVALSHPHPEDYDIQRFTHVNPFSIDEWNIRLKRPTVTFILREDRIWQDMCQYGLWQRLMKRLKRIRSLSQHSFDEQKQRVVMLAQALHQAFPKIDFAVAGCGRPGGVPNWITDLRTLEINKHVERAWCKRYAQSHVVIGVHGSNMLLPSAHAGAVVELVPGNRWGNFFQDILVAPQDVREIMCRHRFLPLNIAAKTVAEVTISLLRYLPESMLYFKRPWCDHKIVTSAPWLIVRRRREIKEKLVDL